MIKKDDMNNLQDRYTWLREITDDAISKRNVSSEFHGLEQELRELQKSLMDAYQRSVQVSHPRDKGSHREEILRSFLRNHGLIPKRYAVGATGIRAVATSGHVSPELDIVLYNNDDTIVLRRLENTIDYLPLESIYGTIQVKSKLTKKALLDGLDNIKKFKSLIPANIEQSMGDLTLATGAYRRFGIIFAYEYNFDWKKTADEIMKFAKSNPPEVWPNLVFILDKGYFRLGSDNKYAWRNRDQLEITDPIVHGAPDLTGSCLLEFYGYLIELLKDTATGAANIQHYLRMPHICDGISYEYSFGAVAELLTCPNTKHGTYLKKFKPGYLKKIIDYVSKVEAVNWIQATEIAHGKDGTDYETYEKQPEFIKIYNPDKLEYKDILIHEDKSMACESINVEGTRIWIPLYYLAKDSMFEDCPKCAAANRKAEKNNEPKYH